MKVQFITPAVAAQYGIHDLNSQTCVESSRSFVYLTRYFFLLFSFLSFLSLKVGKNHFQAWVQTDFPSKAF